MARSLAPLHNVFWSEVAKEQSYLQPCVSVQVESEAEPIHPGEEDGLRPIDGGSARLAACHRATLKPFVNTASLDKAERGNIKPGL
ncbi:unnamed protein product [Boreogadus saida]